MTAYNKPLPPVDDPVQKPFWAAARQHRFELQRCGDCDAFRWPPSPVCPECLTSGGEWTAAPPTGRIWSFAVYDRAYRKEFEADLPYNVALVELDAGPRMISNIIGIEPEALRIGDAVAVAFDDVTPEVTLVKFMTTGSSTQEHEQ